MKFSIRDVLWLTVVVALAVSWWVSYARWSRTNRQLELSLLELRINALRAAMVDPIQLPQFEAEISSLILAEEQFRIDPEAALADRVEGGAEQDSTQQPRESR
jgi:hypothetical protein